MGIRFLLSYELHPLSEEIIDACIVTAHDVWEELQAKPSILQPPHMTSQFLNTRFLPAYRLSPIAKSQPHHIG